MDADGNRRLRKSGLQRQQPNVLRLPSSDSEVSRPFLAGATTTRPRPLSGSALGPTRNWARLVWFFSYDYEGPRGLMTLKPVPDQLVVGGVPAGRYFSTLSTFENTSTTARGMGIAGSTDYQFGPKESNIYLRGHVSPDFHNFGDRLGYSLNDNSGLNLLNGAGGLTLIHNSSAGPRYIIENLVVGRESTYLPVRGFCLGHFRPPTPAENDKRVWRRFLRYSESIHLRNEPPALTIQFATGKLPYPRDWSARRASRRPTTLLFTP